MRKPRDSRRKRLQPFVTSLDRLKNAAYVEASIDVDFDDINGAEKEVQEHYGRLKDAD